MSLGFFREAAARLGLETLRLGYAGGFEPDLVGPEPGELLKRAVLKGLRLLRSLPGAGRLDSPLFSGFIIGLFRKPGAAGAGRPAPRG
jgi:hypothetical protein